LTLEHSVAAQLWPRERRDHAPGKDAARRFSGTPGPIGSRSPRGSRPTVIAHPFISTSKGPPPCARIGWWQERSSGASSSTTCTPVPLTPDGVVRRPGHGAVRGVLQFSLAFVEFRLVAGARELGTGAPGDLHMTDLPCDGPPPHSRRGHGSHCAARVPDHSRWRCADSASTRTARSTSHRPDDPKHRGAHIASVHNGANMIDRRR